MLLYHRELHADMTVAVREQHMLIPYGVVDMRSGGELVNIVEKPVQRYFINAGVYLLSPCVLERMPADVACDMPELIGQALAQGRKVVGFPFREYWLDIGQPKDYERAQTDVENGAL
jgi:NDP-sugar pyrophosphorylase family protein